MQIFVKSFATRTELDRALREAADEDSIFLLGEYAPPTGEPAFVRVTAPGLDPGLFLEARTVSPRARVDDPSSRTSGLDVQLAGPEHARLEFLRAFASEKAEAHSRTVWRYPVRLRVHVHIVSSEQTTGRLLHGTTVNVSAMGALLAISRPMPAPGQAIVMVESGGQLQDFEVRVVWSNAKQAGVRMKFERPTERVAWAKIAEAARSDVETRLVHPLVGHPPARR